MLLRGLKILNKKKAVAIFPIVMAFFCLVFLFGAQVHAQSSPNTVSKDPVLGGIQAVEEPLGLPSTDIRTIIANIIRVGLGFIGIVLVVLVMYGGFLWMTAGGNSDQIDKAKNVLKNAVIGLVIVLSAYSIVLFVMRVLGIGTVGTGFGNNNGGTTIGTQRFAGSGALGRTIKDHYPRRDQTDVPRNAKIIISFKKPILLDKSFVKENTGDSILGNCKPNMKNWETDCDTITLSDNHINIKETKGSKSIKTAAVIIGTSTINNVSGIYNIVLRPITTQSGGGYLGDDTNNIGYTVVLGKNILLDDNANKNPQAFSPSYSWQFITDTKLDQKAPVVNSVYPKNGSTSARNTVIQIDFNKAMDPTGIQGQFSSGGNYYILQGGNVFLIASNSLTPVGRFELVNGYRTLEFSSTQECGKNACGKSIFCLPVCDKGGTTCTKDKYEMLLKSGKTINNKLPEAIPFSGFMDVSGNALDGNADEKVNDPDKPTPDKGGFPISKRADNYFWSFTVSNTIDSTSPYLRYFRPGINTQNAKNDALWQMVFSKRMRVDSLYSISMVESPPKGTVVATPLWYTVNLVELSDSYTTTTMANAKFLKDTDYYPIVSSSVEDVNYNCFYPGVGPNSNNTNNLESAICDGKNNCSAAKKYPDADLYCNGTLLKTYDKQNSKTCIDNLIKQVGK